MGSYRVDDAGIKASLRHSKIIGRAMQNCPEAFRTITVDAAPYDPGMYNLRNDAIRQATKEIDAEDLARQDPLTSNSQKGITNP